MELGTDGARYFLIDDVACAPLYVLPFALPQVVRIRSPRKGLSDLEIDRYRVKEIERSLWHDPRHGQRVIPGLQQVNAFVRGLPVLPEHLGGVSIAPYERVAEIVQYMILPEWEYERCLAMRKSKPLRARRSP